MSVVMETYVLLENFTTVLVKCLNKLLSQIYIYFLIHGLLSRSDGDSYHAFLHRLCLWIPPERLVSRLPIPLVDAPFCSTEKYKQIKLNESFCISKMIAICQKAY